jgi:hypothetical protein
MSRFCSSLKTQLKRQQPQGAFLEPQSLALPSVLDGESGLLRASHLAAQHRALCRCKGRAAVFGKEDGISYTTVDIHRDYEVGKLCLGSRTFTRGFVWEFCEKRGEGSRQAYGKH